MANTKYTHAIVSRVPEVFAIDKRSNTTIHIEEARRQHAGVVNAVRSLGLDVLELPPDETNVASVFTQDLAVVINGIALMCRHHEGRFEEGTQPGCSGPSIAFKSFGVLVAPVFWPSFIEGQ